VPVYGPCRLTQLNDLIGFDLISWQRSQRTGAGLLY